MFRFLIVAFMSIAISISGPALADERLAKLLSEDFARQALEALNTGDRREAIMLALMGTPASPDEDDLETFKSAYEALLLSVVSRSVRLPVEGTPHAAFDPTGRRVATGQMTPRQDGPERPGVQLWDISTGELVADLLSHSEYAGTGYGPGSPAFSLDGRFLAVPANTNSVIHIFDGQTGSPIAKLKGHSTGQQTFFHPPVFNADATLLMTIGGDQSGVRVWRTDDWSLLVRGQDELCSFETPVLGFTDSAVKYLTVPLKSCAATDIVLNSIEQDGSETVLMKVGVAEPGQFASGSIPSLDPSGSFLLMRSNSSFDNFVYDMTGAVVATFPSSLTGFADLKFAIGAEAVVQGSDTFGTSNVRMYDFQGMELDVPIEEHLPLLHHVFTMNGNPIGYGLAFHGTYIGSDLPRGPALVELIEQGLTASERQRVAENRITR